MEPAAIEKRLEGKRVLMTGTGGGQGLAAMELFCLHGAAVYGCDVKEGLAKENAAALRDRGLEAHGATVDLADPEAAAGFVRKVGDHLGAIDVLYNNAGAPAFAPFGEMTLEQWRFTIVNELDILFHVTSPAWEYLQNAGGASIINTASTSGSRAIGGLGQAAHAAAKAGVLGFTRQLAAEGAADGIRANAISPGFTETPGTAVVPAEQKQWLVDNFHMLGRAGRPADIASAALFLASDESALITGIDLPVDAGWLAGKA